MSEVKTCRIPKNIFANIAVGILLLIGLIPIGYAFSIFDHNHTTPVWAAVLGVIAGITLLGVAGMILRASSSIITADQQGIRINGGVSILWSENPVLVDGIKIVAKKKGITVSSQQKHTIISPKGTQISWRTTSNQILELDREAKEVLDFAHMKTQGNTMSSEFEISASYNGVSPRLWIIGILSGLFLIVSLITIICMKANNITNSTFYEALVLSPFFLVGVIIFCVAYTRQGTFIKNANEISGKKIVGGKFSIPVHNIKTIYLENKYNITIDRKDNNSYKIKNVQPETIRILLCQMFS